jgi:hypothetical protein
MTKPFTSVGNWANVSFVSEFGSPAILMKDELDGLGDV